MLQPSKVKSVNTIFLILLFGFFAIFMIYPLLYILVNAFYVDGDFTFNFFWLMLQDPQIWAVILNSINLGLMVTLATTLLSIPLALIMVRTEFPGKGLLNGLLMIPMILPPFVGAVGMRQMFARFGSINLLLMELGLTQQPLDFFGKGDILGVLLMEVLHLYPIMYLNVAAALSNVDPSLEEAAQNVGSGSWTLFRKITFPLMLPGYFAGASIVFIWSFTDLGTPLMFEYRQLVAVQIFDMLNDVHENPMGYVLVVFMILLTLAFFGIAKSTIGNKNYEMLGKGQRGRELGKASWLKLTMIYGFIGIITFAALLPHASVILTSIADRWFMTIAPEALTGKYYGMLLEHPMTSVAIGNSFMLSSLSTILDIVLGITIAYLLTRTQIRGKRILDTLTMLPLAIPGLIIAFGYVAAFSGTFLDARVNPVPLLIFAYALRRLPYMVRSAFSGFQQVSPSLEEAALNVGAKPYQALLKITLPLIFANLIAGGILCFSFAMLEVSDSLILAAEETYYPITKAIYMLMGRPDGPFIASALGVLCMILLGGSLMMAGKFLGRRMGEIFRI